MNNWMNGVPFASIHSNDLDTTNRLFKAESSLSTPSHLFVFIDEDQSTLNDAMFVTTMNPREGFEDSPARRHKTGYPVAFADGHAEIFRFINDNEDLARLRSVTTVSQ